MGIDARPASSAWTRSFWARTAALIVIAAGFGLPIHTLWVYAVLLIAAVLILSGRIALAPRRWAAAVVCIVIAAVLPRFIAPAPIAEGENLFLPDKPGNALERGLPPDVYRFLQTKFDVVYPESVRCKDAPTCWRNMGFPDRLYAFSADGVFGNGGASRQVSTINFSDPIWLRLGFVNDIIYNWGTDAPDVHRGDRDRRFWMGWRRWHIAMPFFLMYRFPADYAGSQLCWTGDVLWPTADGHYDMLSHASTSCRVIEAADLGKPIFAASIAPESLAMSLRAPWAVQVRNAFCAFIAFAAALGAFAFLVRPNLQKALPVFALVASALVVIAIDDMSFISGWRPMDGGDDGLFYTGVGRQILQHLVSGDIRFALIGGENVYYYGGPGLRYFRALEMIVFGDSNLGYLSIVLALPILAWRLFARFLSESFTWRLALIFTLLPIGEIFGTSFFEYAKWAARGFADPLAHIFLIWGLAVLAGRSVEPNARADSALGGALLLALAVFVKPIVAPMAGIAIAGAWLIAVAHREWSKAVAFCVCFTPVLLMPLHNWYFGDQFVLLSSNAQLPGTYVMPPSGYVAALGELVRLDFAGANLHDALAQTGAWLSGPSGLAVFIPLHLVAVLIVLHMTLRGRTYDAWLRLIGAALIAEYGAAMTYAATARYFFSMWFLTALLVCVFLERHVPRWLAQHGWKRSAQALDRYLGLRPANARSPLMPLRLRSVPAAL
jgi:hypothetical protein